MLLNAGGSFTTTTTAFQCKPVMEREHTETEHHLDNNELSRIFIIVNGAEAGLCCGGVEAGTTYCGVGLSRARWWVLAPTVLTRPSVEITDMLRCRRPLPSLPPMVEYN